MTHRLRRLLSAALILACCSSPADGQEDKLELLLKKTPAVPNSMGYVNVASLNKLASGAIRAGASDSVMECWFLADIEFGSMRPKWEAGYVTLKQSIDAAALADQVGGYVDQVVGQDVAYSPRQAYLVPTKENRLGVLRPADRSMLTRWLKGDRAYQSSGYLQSQAKPPEDYLSLMLAFDLTGALSPKPLVERLEDFKSLESQPAETVAKTLASVEGITLLIGRRGLQECILRASFEKPPAHLQPIAANLLAEILSRSGMAAPEVRSWKVKTEGRTIELQGPITEASLLGVLGLFSLQDSAAASAVTFDSDSANRSKEKQVGYRSKAYFDNVNRIVEQTRKHESPTAGALAKWNDARARQIDELGTLKVDPEMVQYGTNVAELLRGNALTVTEGNIATGKTKANQSRYGGYYGYGYGNGYNSARNNQVASAQNRGNAYSDYKSTLSQIDELTASVRRAMTEKYEIQF